MTPVAGAVSNAYKNRLIFPLRLFKSFCTPRKPVYGIVRMLEQVRTVLHFQTIAHIINLHFTNFRILIQLCYTIILYRLHNILCIFSKIHWSAANCRITCVRIKNEKREKLITKDKKSNRSVGNLNVYQKGILCIPSKSQPNNL